MVNFMLCQFHLNNKMVKNESASLFAGGNNLTEKEDCWGDSLNSPVGAGGGGLDLLGSGQIVSS